MNTHPKKLKQHWNHAVTLKEHKDHEVLKQYKALKQPKILKQCWCKWNISPRTLRHWNTGFKSVGYIGKSAPLVCQATCWVI